jgi:molecular chaperone HscB
VNLQSDDFTLFGLPRRFAQERADIDARWKDLQRQAHPDRHAQHGTAAQRVAMQWSVRINEAYQRLKDPLKRAAYLCELGGAPIGAEDNTAMPAAFLMQQMEWREALDEAQGASDIDALDAQVRADPPAGPGTLRRTAGRCAGLRCGRSPGAGADVHRAFCA